MFWLAFGPGLEGGYQISDTFQLNGLVSLLVPARRFAFRLNDEETIHEVAMLLLRVSLGVEVHFP